MAGSTGALDLILTSPLPPASSYPWGLFGPVGSAGDGSPPEAAISPSPDAGVALPQVTAQTEAQSCCLRLYKLCTVQGLLAVGEQSLKSSPRFTCRPCVLAQGYIHPEEGP